MFSREPNEMSLLYIIERDKILATILFQYYLREPVFASEFIIEIMLSNISARKTQRRCSTFSFQRATIKSLGGILKIRFSFSFGPTFPFVPGPRLRGVSRRFLRSEIKIYGVSDGPRGHGVRRERNVCAVQVTSQTRQRGKKRSGHATSSLRRCKTRKGTRPDVTGERKNSIELGEEDRRQREQRTPFLFMH